MNYLNIYRFFISSLWVIWMFTSCTCAFSQDLVHFTQDNGLPSNRVYMMTLDKNGFIWCATDKGIAMYNGDRFTIYTVRNGLPLNDLWKIYASPDGKIWYFGRSNRLGYIEGGIVYSFKTDDGLTMNPTSFDFEDNNIEIIGTDISYRLENNIWKSYGLTISQANTIRSYGYQRGLSFMYANIHKNTVLWFGLNSIYQYDANGNQIARANIEGDPLTYQTYSPTGMFVRDSLFYFHIWDRLCIYNCRSYQLKTIFLNKYFEKQWIRSMFMFYEDGKIIFNGPAGKYQLNNDSVISVIQPIDIPGYKINNWFRDSLNNTWVSTLNNGIILYPFYNTIPSIFDGENVQFLTSHKGVLYAGVENDGLYKIVGNGNEWIKTTGKFFYGVEAVNDSTLRVLTNSEIGTLKGTQLNQIELVDTFYYYQFEKRYHYVSPNAKCYYKDSGGEYWANAATFFSRTPSANTAVLIMGVYQILRFNGRIVLGTNTGIRIVDPKGNKTIEINETGKVNKLFLFRDHLLIGTDGLGLFTYKDSVGSVNGMEDLTIHNITSSSDTSMWVATNMGVHEVLFSKGVFRLGRSVLRSNGLMSNMVNDVEIRGDSLYCATENGLCIIALTKLKLKNDPRIIFTRKLINDSLFTIRDTIEIMSRGSNSINVGFDIAFLNEHSQLKNYYRIEPINKEWSPLNSSGFTVDGLSPGKYTVRIKTEGLNGNKDEKSFVLIIQPRWFETTWFIVGAIILSVVLVGLIIFLIATSVIRARNRKLKLENQLVNLELYALRSKLNPHFIFNTFNAIQLYINSNQLELSEKYLILLSKHIRNVFEFSHLQKISLEKEIHLLRDYLEIEKTRFGDKIYIRIYVDDRINTDVRQIPSMIVQPYVENSMVHGLFHKDGIGYLTVDFQYVDENTYKVQIIDDGIGFIETQSQRISSTKVNRDRIELINQSGEFHISVEKSYLDESKKDKGTIITLTITDGTEYQSNIGG